MSEMCTLYHKVIKQLLMKQYVNDRSSGQGVRRASFPFPL